MEYGFYKIINKTACYYETAFNITVILGQLSDCDNMLKEQADTRKDAQSAQRKMISEEHILKARLREKKRACAKCIRR